MRFFTFWLLSTVLVIAPFSAGAFDVDLDDAVETLSEHGPEDAEIQDARFVRFVPGADPQLVIEFAEEDQFGNPREALHVFDYAPAHPQDWAPISEFPYFTFGTCDTHKADSGRDVLLCVTADIGMGYLTTVASAIGLFDGEIQRVSIETYSDPTAGGSIVEDHTFDIARITDIESRVDGETFVVDVAVDRAVAEMPRKYERNVADAINDGWQPPETAGEVERFRLTEDRFVPVE